MIYPSKNYIPATRKHLQEFADHKLATEKYNELLSQETTQSIYMDKVPNKKGYWQIEWETYTEKWLKKYGNK